MLFFYPHFQLYVCVSISGILYLNFFSNIRAIPFVNTPPSMGFSRQEYWSGLPFPSPGDLPDLGIEPEFPALQADSLPTDLQRKPQ